MIITISIPDLDANEQQVFSDLVVPYLQSLGYSGTFRNMIKQYAMDKVVYNLQEKAREYKYETEQQLQGKK